LSCEPSWHGTGMSTATGSVTFHEARRVFFPLA